MSTTTLKEFWVSSFIVYMAGTQKGIIPRKTFVSMKDIILTNSFLPGTMWNVCLLIKSMIGDFLH